ncbi:MAG: hypothetical protein HY401_10455 [Elusimicrobia bacterium]|nr:hypothetical protein [Elusimicrobiota bacterium]
MSILVFLVLGLMVNAVTATGPATAQSPRFIDGGQSLALPPDKPVLFVTHGTAGYDFGSQAKKGIDRLVRVFKTQNWPVLYLNDCCHPKEYPPYMKDSKVTAEICSDDGNHNVTPVGRHIVLTGGNYDECARRTFTNAVKNGFAYQIRHNQAHPVLVVHYVLDALYSKWGNLKEELEKHGIDFNDPKSYLLASQLLRQGFPWHDESYRTQLYYENLFLETTGSNNENSPLLIIRLTTSETLEKTVPLFWER